MKKYRGQSLIDFAMISLLGVSIILFGLYQLGDKMGSFFARNDQEKKFNNARTIKFEKPTDIVSKVTTVTVGGVTIQPPVEKIIKDQLLAGTYIQTSGSAGRMVDSLKIMSKYVDEIKKLTAGEGNPGDRAAFEADLDALKTSVETTLTTHATFTGNEPLEQKLNLIQMAASTGGGVMLSDLSTTLATYITTVAAGGKHDVISTFSNDLLSFGNGFEYYLDPELYVEFLHKEKNNTKTQDLALISAMQAAVGAMTQAQQQEYSGLVKVFYTSGYSQTSPSAYNGYIMCGTFAGGVLSADGTTCTIP